MENFILYPWHWLVTGLVLIGLEALGFGGFLLGGALAGLIMSVVSWMDSSLKWTVQVIIFSGLTVIFTIIYWRLFKKFNQKSNSPLLNDRAAQLHGKTVKLTQDIPATGGRIQIGDTLWKVKSQEFIKKETIVIIYGNEGMTLLIKPAKDDV